MMRMQITHITKNDFFFFFKRVFFIIIGEKNVRAEFSSTGLISYNSEIVINCLNFKPKTPTPLNSRLINIIFINLNTLKTARNAVRNSTNLKSKIAKYQSSFLTHLYELINTQIKDIFKLTHKMMLFKVEIKIFRTINEIFNKQRRVKKIRV